MPSYSTQKLAEIHFKIILLQYIMDLNCYLLVDNLALYISTHSAYKYIL